MIRAILLSSAAILSCYISNCRQYFTLSDEINLAGSTSDFMKLLILSLFFHVYFLNMDISLNIYTLVITFYTGVLNIPLEGTMSQISYLGPSFYFMIKKRVTFGHFLKLYFQHFIKLKLGPK